MERKPIWLCTLATQLCLFSALYIALNMGHPQTSIYRERDQFYFISVSGGFRPLQLQTLLLKKIDGLDGSCGEILQSKIRNRTLVSLGKMIHSNKMAKIMAVVCSLLNLFQQLATTLHVSFAGYPALPISESSMVYYSLCNQFSDLGTFTYTTRVSEEKEVGCFREQIKLPHGEMLEIVGVDTGSLQETMLARFSNGTGDNQLSSLTRTLEATNGHWCIVVGFHPLVICEDNKEEIKAKKIYEPLHRIFMKLGVNAYLSKHGCAEFARQDSVAYIENPDLIESVNGRGMVDGFLLHRVSSLEIVTYFVTSAGEVVYRTVIQQRGREAM
ncbi:hypothetical protein Pint_14573 [Pistacia integerrima]|uniref:Uncharacterized protein n=1 Tax=Pistacia integerrima TaxID=434235 RepID=A0ACC0YAR5_9ROSI|nr:hypothetical protein Pint_14573 [Pistacia integerrima]